MVGVVDYEHLYLLKPVGHAQVMRGHERRCETKRNAPRAIFPAAIEEIVYPDVLITDR